jgi:hypothetical protein
MLMFEALCERLKEPALVEAPLRCVEMRFSPDAFVDLFFELHHARYTVRHLGKMRYACYDKKGGIGFAFACDDRLEGKSFVLRLKNAEVKK